MYCTRRGALVTDCMDIGGQSSCFTDTLETPQACRPLTQSGNTNVTQPLGDMLADGSAGDASDGTLCKLYDNAGADIGAVNVSACHTGLACTPLQVRATTYFGAALFHTLTPVLRSCSLDSTGRCGCGVHEQ